ncbi:MAG: alcohol dehydrogenase catalytic domain-containing protein [Woeseiaceae bacterium]|nr:alcohol dehydrogenase catalytic domain-containing protein [Woeseiaceae bacterium]
MPRAGEVLIRVAAAGVNRPDVLQRMGRYPAPADADPLPGLEVAGRIEALGKGVDDWQSGDRVMALAHGGGYAEFCRVPAAHCLPVPDALTDVEAAAVPETFFTVWYNVFMRAALQPNYVQWPCRCLKMAGSNPLFTGRFHWPPRRMPTG